MATMTTQDRYVENKTNEVMALLDQLKALNQKLQAERGKARGAATESDYLFALDGLKVAAGGATYDRFYTVKTYYHNNRVFGR